MCMELLSVRAVCKHPPTIACKHQQDILSDGTMLINLRSTNGHSVLLCISVHHVKV